MAEQQSKGIALVILGIVAIIAIVGLVLLFTGARKAATGEFAVPTAKEYGGSIRGLSDPYSRAFVGRSVEFPSGVSGETPYDKSGVYSGLGQQMVKVAGVVTGEDATVKTVSNPISYNRNQVQIDSQQTSCNGWTKTLTQLGYAGFDGQWIDLSAQQAQGFQGRIVPVSDILQILSSTTYYGADRILEAQKLMGHLYCGQWQGGGNNPGSYSSNPAY